MNSTWAPLLPLAMVGTDRMASALPSWPGAVGELISQAASSTESASTGALRVAAVLATCDVAASQGIPWTDPLPPAAANDPLPTLAEPNLQALVKWALHEGSSRLHHDICLALDRLGLRLPYPLLPQALELGRRSAALRQRLLPVLGERGLWLATQRDEWRYAAGVSAEDFAETLWTEGSIEQRRAFLVRERLSDPGEARKRLKQSLDELAPKERADLVSALAHSLGSDDEPLLDHLRSDRAREVRQAALGLLLRLPSAAHPKRAADRLAALLTQERVLLRKKWQIDAPTSFDDAWKADNLDPARPKNHALGERAWWLYQLVRQIPLGWWTEHTGMDVSELRRWIDGTDWADAVLLGWRDVLFAAPEPAWCEAFLDDWPTKSLRDDPATVLALLPVSARERHWLRQLKESGASLPAITHQILAACPAGETLSNALSTELVDHLFRLAGSGRLGNDHAMRALVPELGCVLSADTLDRFTQLPEHADDRPSFTENWQVAMRAVAVRQALLSFTPTRTP